MNLSVKIKEPNSSLGKIKLARGLYEEMKQIREMRDIAGWYLGKILYYFDKYKLHNYLFGKALSKNAFYAEIDIPHSTVSYYITLYEFYIVDNQIDFKLLRNSATRKLHRAIPLLKGKPKDKIMEAVELAKRETLSLSDYLENIKEI